MSTFEAVVTKKRKKEKKSINILTDEGNNFKMSLPALLNAEESEFKPAVGTLLLSQEVFPLTFFGNFIPVSDAKYFSEWKGRGFEDEGGASVRLGPLISRRDQSWFRVSGMTR